MRTGHELFHFELRSPLTHSQVAALSLATGMIIGDVHNPSKDLPGQGRLGERVFIRLGRGSEEGLWYIRAVGYSPEQEDIEAARSMQEQLRRMLSSIGTWDESGPKDPARPPVLSRHDEV